MKTIEYSLVTVGDTASCFNLELASVTIPSAVLALATSENPSIVKTTSPVKSSTVVELPFNAVKS